MFGTPERLPAFGTRTFSTVITASVLQDLNEKIAGVDCTYDALIIHCVVRIVAEPFFHTRKWHRIQLYCSMHSLQLRSLYFLNLPRIRNPHLELFCPMNRSQV
jgi:hypothetical protein